MRVDLIELLRCPANHEPAPLITVADRRAGEHLLDASLGCVVCGANYSLRDGVLYLSGNVSAARTMAAAHRSQVTSESLPESPTAHSATNADAMRIAALLNLVDASSRAVLCGRSLHLAEVIEATTGAPIVNCNPTNLVFAGDAGAVHADVIVSFPLTRLPLADQSLGGIAVDMRHEALLDDARRVVRVGGRILAPVSTRVPAGCRELARDAHEWVAEVDAPTSVPIRLSRAR